MSEVNHRQSEFNKLKLILVEVEKHDAGTPLSLAAVDTMYEKAASITDKMEKLHDTIIGVCQDDADVTLQGTVFATMMTTSLQVRSRLLGIRRGLHAASASTSSGSTSAHSSAVKLPRIEIPTFDGSFESWTSFKDLFVATIDSNPDLSPAQRLQYLKGAVRNEAANLIRSLPVTNPNYKEAWDILTARYDNQREIVSSLLNRLFGAKSLSQESATDLQRLLDNTSESVRALKVQGVPVDQWDLILIHLIVTRLDPNTRREWAVQLKGTTLPTYKELTDFLANHIRGLLASGAIVHSSNRTANNGRKTVLTHFTTTNDLKCPVCSHDHPLYKCHDFNSRATTEREQLVREHKLCFNCLRKHRASQCTSKSSCRKCGKAHHTLLHRDRSDDKPPQPKQYTADSGPSQTSSHATSTLNTHHVCVDTQVLLPTAIVRVTSRSNGEQLCRILLDTGSEGTFISEECATRLGLKRHPSNLQVNGVASVSAGHTKGMVNLILHSRITTDELPISAHVLPRVSGLLPRQPIHLKELSHIKGLELADPHYNEQGVLDILLGADYCCLIMRNGIRTGPPMAPIAQSTIFGWVLMGRVGLQVHREVNSHHAEMELELGNILRRFWEIEEPPTAITYTPEERESELVFTTGYSRTTDGRFVVPVPYKKTKPQLGYSRDIAVGRLRQVERRLHRYPQYRIEYNKFMAEYISLGHMERIPKIEVTEQLGKTNYLPHHFVLNSSSTSTKFRVVFDGSCKTKNGVSLNDTMLVGAPLQDELYSILLRFRLHAVVIKADIAKMFRQFLLKPDDANLHRIVWRESPSAPVEDFRLLTVTYGTACAPFLSTRCMKELATLSQPKYPVAARVLDEDLYVDDIMSGATDTQSGIQLYEDLTSAVAGAQLQLRKWASNDPAVLAHIPEDLREVNPLSLDKEQSIKALGVQWNPTSDIFSFCSLPLPQKEIVTKRSLLADLARVFDPLGFLSAVTITGKIIMQDLWRISLGWDEPLPEELAEAWRNYSEDLEAVREIAIPRRITTNTAIRYEIHGFSDASERAYGAVLYLRAVDKEGAAQVTLITSKAKVAPLRQVSLARLELCGAVLLSELLQHVDATMKLPCDKYAWCDSTIVLRWISAPSRKWKTFIANRVAQIQANTATEIWRHVPGHLNPADLASRGVPATHIYRNSFWWEGPQWLQLHSIPIFGTPELDENANLEERKTILSTHFSQFDLSLLQRFSSYMRLKRVTAYLLRFYYNAKFKRQPSTSTSSTSLSTGSLTTFELRRAHNIWAKMVQQQHFPKELSCLLKMQPLPLSSKLLQLNPYLDQDGLIRVGGRLANSGLPEWRKHQVVLPRESQFTDLIVLHTHHINLHSGFTLTWSTLQMQYWIMGGRDKVRHLVRKCVVCRRHRAAASKQLMAPLPSQRVNPSRPFLHTGVDYAGPFWLKPEKKRGNAKYKAYLCLFVCMATKAMHLEAVSELTTSAFLASLRRFVSRRGLSSHIYSDCGTNFVGADRELQRLMKAKQHHNQITDDLSTVGVQWHFNSPSAPHHGGLWEAGVKSAKFHLKRVMGETLLTYEQFQTILCQVEATLNSRPLAPVSSDPTDLSALTPGHFLIGEALNAAPDEQVTHLKENRLCVWQRQQQRVQHFWRRWSLEYLNQLQQRNKWTRKQPNLRVGDMVVVREDNTSPGEWKLGRVKDVHVGGDGLVRTATVLTTTGVILRPIRPELAKWGGDESRVGFRDTSPLEEVVSPTGFFLSPRLRSCNAF